MEYLKSVIPVIESNYVNFTTVERSIADFFIYNREQMDFSAKSVAGKLFVSEASLSRFAKKCGFRGYREFIYQYEENFVRSPGMKYKHYAPKADVTLLDGTFEQFKAYVDAHAAENPSCLCFTGEAEKLGVPCVEYGREGDGADQAKHIFRSLRALDEQGDAVVYARCPQKDGLSMAVYNA